jgi:glyoxylase-like metal-dependent hydrolase (beta-lactamase superfamily II)
MIRNFTRPFLIPGLFVFTVLLPAQNTTAPRSAYPAASSSASGVRVAVPTGPNSSQQASGFYRGRLGAFEVTAFSDGTTPRHMDQILSNPEMVNSELKADHETEPIPISINAYLINTGTHVVLIDTGAGEIYAPTSGLLIKNMKAAGYEAAQVDTILLTHIHADHSGGLVVKGNMQFPNATVYVDERDIKYFVTRKDTPDESPVVQLQVRQSRATIGVYLKAGKVIPITSDGEILPGITSILRAGHTPGHRTYLVQSEGHQILFWGDTIHSSEVQFAHPEVTVAYDVDPKQAATTRLSELELTAGDGLLVASDHIYFPGIGHVRKLGSEYAWVPLPYNATAVELDPK